MIGPTGTGKTTLARYLLRARTYVTMFNTKGTDTSATKYQAEGYVKQTKRWDGSHDDRIMLWPEGKSMDEKMHYQYHIFNQGMEDMVRQGGWTIYLDEVSYMSDFLNMGKKLKMLLQQGRSENVSIVGATQRPAFIPLAFYDQPEHLIFWHDNDEVNLKRVRNIGGESGNKIKAEVQSLEHREVLYIHTRHPHERYRFHIKLPKGG